MPNWEREDVLSEIQKKLPWAVVLDIFSGEGWLAIPAMGQPPAEPVPVRYFVKVEPLPARRKRQSPQLAVAIEDPNGQLVVHEGSRIALLGLMDREGSRPAPGDGRAIRTARESGGRGGRRAGTIEV